MNMCVDMLKRFNAYRQVGAGAPWEKAKNLTVVVTSGSGGTGFVAIQLAKAYGAAKVWPVAYRLSPIAYRLSPIACGPVGLWAYGL